METIHRGRAWTFGDDVDTDAIIPSMYLVHQDPGVWAAHIMEGVMPDFAHRVAQGDFVVAGRSFGSGSSREHAAIGLRQAGVWAVFAESFARNFYRNAFNNGLIAMEVPGISHFAKTGDELELALESGRLCNARSQEEILATPLPPFLMEMVAQGGLIAWLLSGGGWERTGQG